jgi:nucleoid associated protein NdpA
MIHSDDLASMQVGRVIFHDVPRSVKGVTAEPTLSDVETEIDPIRKSHLKKKLTQVLGSRSAYPVVFKIDSGSLVPTEVRTLTKVHKPQQYVEASQRLARYLLEHQVGSVSPGLLCVISVTASSLNGLVLMKLEREEGAQLQPSGEPGKRTFMMSVLDNLVLTDGTRLFKSAMFLRTGPGDDDFRAAACDSQLNVMSSDDMAKFWMRYLGTTFEEEPRVATYRFYEATMRFVNHAVTDPLVKNDIYESLHSELKANKKTFSPKTFIQEYIPHNLQKPVREHFEIEKVSSNAFQKDLSDIEGKLRRRSYETHKGAMITVPVEVADLVVVRAKDIVVKDTVRKIK